MKILKQENWWIWLLLLFFSEGTSLFVLGALLDVYDKNAWYAKWQYWVIGILLFLMPAFIMFTVFTLEILCKVAGKLAVPGSEFYLSPYIWILLLIIPIFGWILFIVWVLYLQIMIIIRLYKGAAEQYIEN